MGITNFRKESSERSDSQNWAKELLMNIEGIHLESIEGCNQNADNTVTHLIERARIDIEPGEKAKKQDVIDAIIQLEGEARLQRKINFANCFDTPLYYALYCDEAEKVYLIRIKSLTEIEPYKTFQTYTAFSNWIQGIKGWISRKKFREIDDLPYFDKALRKAGCAWPTNIDCFITNDNNEPIAILEFQNAKNTRVKEHCNNDFFLCKMSSINSYGYPQYHDDIRRWVSQEILRVQSGLRYFIITWSQNEEDYILKELELVTAPEFPQNNGKVNWDIVNAYKRDLNKFVNNGKQKSDFDNVANNYQSYNLYKVDTGIQSQVNEPPLSYSNQTFPSLYYSSKKLVEGTKGQIVADFKSLLGI